jgi:hypothetical protein
LSRENPVIRQPWTYPITQGSKNIENRNWPTKYRDPLLIHASLNVDKKDCRDHGFDPAKLQTGGNCRNGRNRGLRSKSIRANGLRDLTVSSSRIVERFHL